MNGSWKIDLHVFDRWFIWYKETNSYVCKSKSIQIIISLQKQKWSNIFKRHYVILLNVILEQMMGWIEKFSVNMTLILVYVHVLSISIFPMKRLLYGIKT